MAAGLAAACRQGQGRVGNTTGGKQEGWPAGLEFVCGRGHGSRRVTLVEDGTVGMGARMGGVWRDWTVAGVS